MADNTETRYQVRVVRRHMLAADGTFTQDAVVAKTKVSRSRSQVIDWAHELEKEFPRGSFAYMESVAMYPKESGR